MSDEPAKIGRPRKEINIVEVDKLCRIQCLEQEIADWFEMSVDTLERRILELTGVRFAEYYRQKRGDGRIAIRRKQFQAALKGDRTMLVWLGKNMLGQKDSHTLEHSGSIDFYASLTADERKARLEELRNKLVTNG